MFFPELFLAPNEAVTHLPRSAHLPPFLGARHMGGFSSATPCARGWWRPSLRCSRAAAWPKWCTTAGRSGANVVQRSTLRITWDTGNLVESRLNLVGKSETGETSTSPANTQTGGMFLLNSQLVSCKRAGAIQRELPVDVYMAVTFAVPLGTLPQHWLDRKAHVKDRNCESWQCIRVTSPFQG